MQLIAPFVSPAEVAANTAARHTQGTDTTLGTMTADINMGGYSITLGNIIKGGIDVEVVTENTLLTYQQCASIVVFVNGAYTVTLPLASTCCEGANITIFALAAQTIKLDLNDNDRFILDGSALTDAHMLDSAGAAGDYITVVKDSDAGWTVIGRSGTWTDGGTS